jgi:hypothetical protein
MALTFVPAVFGTHAAPAPALLRGAATQAPPAAAGSLVTPSMAMLVCGAVAVGKRSRKTVGTARRFFDGDAPFAPKEIKSYKDFSDPWLGSADLGFDPLNVSVSAGTFDKSVKDKEAVYYNYRESEVKHGRFAMTAFLAIFFESADRSAVLHQLGQVKIEDKLDGTLGLDEVQAPVLLAGLALQATAEFNLQREKENGDFSSVEFKKERCPGDLGFDPIGLSKGPGADVKGLHNIEVNTGRLAMIGLTTFLFKEFLVKDAWLAAKIL